MTSTIQAIFGVVALVLLFLPAILLIVASVKIIKIVQDAFAVWIAMGAVLLTLTALEFLYSFFIALLLGPEEIASYAIYSIYLFKGMNYLALVLIGIGLLRFSKRLTWIKNLDQ